MCHALPHFFELTVFPDLVFFAVCDSPKESKPEHSEASSPTSPSCHTPTSVQCIVGLPKQSSHDNKITKALMLKKYKLPVLGGVGQNEKNEQVVSSKG